MKKVRISSGRGGTHYRDIWVPETREEALKMLVKAMNPALDGPGGDATRNSVAGRVAFGLFGEGTPNPTVALNLLLKRLCENHDVP